MNANPADEILPGLWLGNINASKDLEFLKEKRIRSVFNCTKDIPFSDIKLQNYRLPVDDNLQEEEIRNMELWSIETIYKLYKEYAKGPVLVHCHAGMQRSAAVVAMYLISKKDIKYEQAKAYIQERRAIAFRPKANFEKSIRGFESIFDKDIRPHLNRPPI